MIRGLGVDILELERLNRALQEHGQRFLNHVFTAEEQENAPERRQAAGVYYAGRWCAKEATAKALGTGVGEECSWKEVNILQNNRGKPQISLSGRALETMQHAGATDLFLTITHEKSVACAVVVAEAVET